jgi:hypothetical protein
VADTKEILLNGSGIAQLVADLAKAFKELPQAVTRPGRVTPGDAQ